MMGTADTEVSLVVGGIQMSFYVSLFRGRGRFFILQSNGMITFDICLYHFGNLAIAPAK